MKEEVKTFLEETFHEIQNSVYNDGYEDAACDYSVEDGVLEIAIGRYDSIDEIVVEILEERLSTLSDDNVECDDYFEISVYEKSVDVGRGFNLYIYVHNIAVETKIEKLEELFNKN